MVAEPAALFCKVIGALLHLRVQPEDQVIKRVHAGVYRIEDAPLLLPDTEERERGEFDEVLDADLLVVLVVLRDGRDHPRAGDAAADVGSDGEGAQGVAHVDDDIVPVILLLPDEFRDLACGPHDIELVHAGSGHIKERPEIVLQLLGHLAGLHLPAGLLLTRDEDDLLD